MKGRKDLINNNMANRNVFYRMIFLLVFTSALGIIPAFGQSRSALPEDMWVCPVVESGYYGLSNIAFGGGAALGYGDRVAFGLKALYWTDIRNEVRSLELNLLARFYLPALFRPTASASSGFFVQINGGPVLLARDENSIAMPS